MKRHKFLPGSIFNRLAPLKDLGVVRGNSLWLCLCECGTTKRIKANSVVTGRTKSCGCLGREISSKKLKDPDTRPKQTYKIKTYEDLFEDFKKNAVKRKRPCSLTLAQFKGLVTSNCTYCNREPFKTIRTRNKSNVEPLKYTGIDRLDNEFGYTLQNSVPCCYDCNIAKHRKTVFEFLEIVKLIYETQELNRYNPK